MQIGREDVFERSYTQKFRELAGRHGEFVTYERDRAARDLGLHLTRKVPDGSERLSSTLCWFQLKGVHTSTLSEADIDSLGAVPVRLETRHLRFWYLQPMPTYLIVYAEAVDTFFYLNLHKHLESTLGQAILTLPQKSMTVQVPKNNILDDDVFSQILKASDVRQWQEYFSADEETVRLAMRDFNIISRAASAEERGVEQRMVIWDWQSKSRGEVRFEERKDGTDEEWVRFHEHWQFMLRGEDVEGEFPYLSLTPRTDEDEGSWLDDFDDDDHAPVLTLRDGTEVTAENAMNEVHIFELSFSLNDLGRQLWEWINIMEQTGILHIKKDATTWMSKAPWHWRDV